MHANRFLRSSIPAALVVVALVAACGSAPRSPASSDPPTSASPSQSERPSPSAPPSAPPSVPPTAKPSDSPAPAPALNDAEKALIALLRPDARDGCRPRRADLPSGATAGVECRPLSALGIRVGAYVFPSDQDAAKAYFARLAANGVDPRSGDCSNGVPGDNAWTPGDDEGEVDADDPYGVVWDGIPYVVSRDGCFLDEAGQANARAVCGGGLYLGVVAATADVKLVYDWMWKYAPGIPVSTPSAPGLCVSA